MHTKAQIREACLAGRDRLTAAEVKRMSAAIHDHLRSMAEFSMASEILVYVSKDNEVETQALITELLAVGRNVRVPISRTHGQLSLSALESVEDLEPGAFGVLEPIPSQASVVQPQNDALVLVPCVAFAESGHRLGYGKGYFDRFLSGHRGLAIGLAFEIQKVPHLLAEVHDVTLDMIVTEDRIYRSA